MKKYLPKEFEEKLVEEWEREGVYRTGKPAFAKATAGKAYTLAMFPYPSGSGLHVGHVRIYTGTDVLARYFRMNGYSVLHPMGWDAFGLPAENAAIKEKKNPMDMVPDNIATFKSQMRRLGFSYDWDREFATTDPAYYKWTQWLFIQFFKKGLLYKKKAPIYFCESCKTGLAQEEALADGTHERCGNPVTQKQLPQWIFRITKYAERLLEDLEGLDWPRGILEMQRNWIGKKTGVIIPHEVEEIDGFTLDTFSAYPAWSFADSFIVVAPEHPLVDRIKNQKSKIKTTDKNSKLLKQIGQMEKYIETVIIQTPQERLAEGKEKNGVFTGYYAYDPFRPGEKMPIWIANFAVMDVGTGAIRCSGHDTRDVEFAKKYDIKLRTVVHAPGGAFVNAHDNRGVLEDSGPFTGKEVGQIEEEFVDWMEKEDIGKRHVSYHLRDWIFSRQRYWGEPIPMVYCEACAKNQISSLSHIVDPTLNPSPLKGEGDAEGIAQKKPGRISEIEADLYGWFPVPEEELPVELPKVKSYEPTKTGESPLSQIKDWVETKCPNCGGQARRETDTMPNWAGSCWYYLYFSRNTENSKTQAPNHKKIQSTHRSKAQQRSLKHSFFGSSKLFDIWNLELGTSGNLWLPVDWYLGGAEHAVLHLLYARFWSKVMYDLGLCGYDEPFTRLRNVGMVLAEDGKKMSKSLGNVINPDDVVGEYGADTLRVYEMFIAPFSQEVAWSTHAVAGAHRFLTRIWRIYHDPAYIANDENQEDKSLVTELQRVIGKVTADITHVKFNTPIASLMSFVNEWEGSSVIPNEVRNPATKGSEKEKDADAGSFIPPSGIQDDKKTRKLYAENAKKFLKLLAPFAPFITDEIWKSVFGENSSIHLSKWPTADESALEAQEKAIPVQVDGKVRDILRISATELSEDAVVKEALQSEKVKKWVGEKKHEVIYVQGKILNFVTD